MVSTCVHSCVRAVFDLEAFVVTSGGEGELSDTLLNTFSGIVF